VFLELLLDVQTYISLPRRGEYTVELIFNASRTGLTDEKFFCPLTNVCRDTQMKGVKGAGSLRDWLLKGYFEVLRGGVSSGCGVKNANLQHVDPNP
jgi:hypothetical protein